MSVANDEDPQADYGDTRPAKQIHFFSEEQESENGDDEIGKGRGRLDIAVVSPGEHEHVGDEKSEQAGDPEPDVAGGEDSNQDVKELLRLPIAGGADGFHSFAEQHIAERSKEGDEEKENVGFQVETWRIFHAIRGLLPREVLFVFLKTRPDHLTRCRLLSKALKGEIDRFFAILLLRNETGEPMGQALE